MNNEFKQGYNYFIENSTAQISSNSGSKYVSEIEEEILDFTNTINTVFKDTNKGIGQLKGDIAEFWHSGTFNINAKVNGNSFETYVDRSNQFASADITSNFDQKFGLKYYYNGTASAKEQSTSYFEAYHKYKSNGRDLSFESYLLDRKIDPNTAIHDPIYTGQIRIIPKDQLEEAIEFLKRKIDKESITRPEQVKRYQDTLNLLSDKIKGPGNTNSISLSENDSKLLAQYSKDGNFKASDFNLSTEELIQFNHILKQGLKAGTTAAIITFILKIAPEIYKTIDELIKKGYIDDEALKELGFRSLNASAESFLRGTVSASLTIACQSGVLGNVLKSATPSSIAAITVVCFSTIKDSFDLIGGKISKEILLDNLAKNIFVTSCSLGFGNLFQTLIPLPVIGYLLGNFIGSMLGNFAYEAGSNLVLSFAINNGITFFGLYDQNYTLSEAVLKEIGIDIFEYEKHIPNQIEFEKIYHHSFNYDKIETTKHIERTILRRGVIGVRQIGYV